VKLAPITLKMRQRTRNNVAKEYPDAPILENCDITFIGAGATQENYITRAIIKLSGDITPCLPHLSRVIENCGYSPDVKSIAFRFQNMPVVIRSDTITINNMADLETARGFLDWLKEKIKTAV
jgi:ArsR family metal-binding transcriptional regulator